MSKKQIKVNKNYTISLPKNLVNRLQFIKKIEKKNIDISKDSINFFYELVSKLENESGIKSNCWYQSKKCPECDSYLVIKTGKNGDFYGCYSYPDCKKTETINTKIK